MPAITFLYTGSAQTFTVPVGCTKVVVDMCGGAAERVVGSEKYGFGDRVQFTLAVSPGDVLTLYPGDDNVVHSSNQGFYSSGSPGYSGGGAGGGHVGTGNNDAPGGGGSSAILKSGTLIAEASGGVGCNPTTKAPYYGAGGAGSYRSSPGIQGYAALNGGNGTTGGGGGGSQGGSGGSAGGTGAGTAGSGVGGGTAGGAGGATTPWAGGTSLIGSGGHASTAHNGYSFVSGTNTSAVSYSSQANTGYITITTPGPLAPDLENPTNGSTIPADPPFAWDYTPSVGGNTMTGYVLRYKTVGASAYSYYNAGAGWGSPSSTPVVNSATSPGVTPTSGTFPVGQQYQWSVANVDQGGEGQFATDAVWTSQAPPTVSITAPLGTLTEAAATISWTASSAVALANAAVEVYTAAQWAFIGGQAFMGGSKVTGSGTLTEPVTQWSTPAGTFVSGTTYYIAVKITDSSGEFTIASVSVVCQYDGPGVPRLFAIPTVDGNGVPCVELGGYSTDNVLTADDSSLETTIGTWAALSNCSVARTALFALDGTHCLAMQATAAGTMSSFCGPYTVTPGQSFGAVASFLANPTARNCQVALRWENSGTFVSATTSLAVADNSSTWAQAVIGAIVPSGVNQVYIQIVVNSAAINEIHEVDCIGLFGGTPIGAYAASGQFITSTKPVFQPTDVGNYVTDSHLTGNAQPITAYVSPYEVQVAVAPSGSGTNLSLIPNEWALGGMSPLGLWITATDTVTGVTRYVRGASAANPITGQTSFTVYDYESTPQHLTDYSLTEQATSLGATVATSSVSAPSTLVTDRAWIFDPTSVADGDLYVDGTVTAQSLSRGEYETPHKQVGNPYLSIITDTVGGVDGSMTLRVQGAARWQQLVGSGVAGDTTSLSTCQRTVCISDPLGMLYYGRLGIAPGGTTSGSASATITGAFVQADIDNQVRDVSLTFVSQPAPGV